MDNPITSNGSFFLGLLVGQESKNEEEKDWNIYKNYFTNLIQEKFAVFAKAYIYDATNKVLIFFLNKNGLNHKFTNIKASGNNVMIKMVTIKNTPSAWTPIKYVTNKVTLEKKIFIGSLEFPRTGARLRSVVISEEFFKSSSPLARFYQKRYNNKYYDRHGYPNPVINSIIWVSEGNNKIKEDDINLKQFIEEGLTRDNIYIF